MTEDTTKYGLTATDRSQGVAMVMSYRVSFIGIQEADVQDVALIVWDYVNVNCGGDGLDHSLCEKERSGLVRSCVKAVKSNDVYRVLPVIWIIALKFIVGLLIDWWLTKHKFVVSECGEPD